MEKEIFRDIKGFENFYQISNYGRIKSLERIDKSNHLVKEKILKLKTDKYGYLQAALCKDGKMKHIAVHRLVAMAFIPNPNNYPQCNHIDENKKNNYVQNLEWCTVKYNINFGTRNERTAQALKGRIVSEKTRKKIGEVHSKPVLQLDKKTEEIIAEFPSTYEVERKLGFCHNSISQCCLKKPHYNTAYGFKWRFK